MYLSTFPLSEYCFNDDIVVENNEDYDICLICWMPSETNNSITILSEFSHIVTLCKCKSKFHSVCVNNWISKSHSCPICRKIITIKNMNININKQNEYLPEKYKTIIRMICVYLISVNVCYLFWYNIYYFVSLC